MPSETIDPRLASLIEHLERTTDAQWLVDRVRDNHTGAGCLMSHVFDWGGGDTPITDGFNKNGGTEAWNWFEAIYATTYMVYPVNDGENAKYQQVTPRERCIAYLKDLRDGNEKTTLAYEEEYEAAWNAAQRAQGERANQT